MGAASQGRGRGRGPSQAQGLSPGRDQARIQGQTRVQGGSLRRRGRLPPRRLGEPRGGRVQMSKGPPGPLQGTAGTVAAKKADRRPTLVVLRSTFFCLRSSAFVRPFARIPRGGALGPLGGRPPLLRRGHPTSPPSLGAGPRFIAKGSPSQAERVWGNTFTWSILDHQVVRRQFAELSAPHPWFSPKGFERARPASAGLSAAFGLDKPAPLIRSRPDRPRRNRKQ